MTEDGTTTDRTIQAEISPAVGKRGSVQFDVVLSGYPRDGLRYLRLSHDELMAISEAVTRLTVGDKGIRVLATAENAGAPQGVLL